MAPIPQPVTAPPVPTRSVMVDNGGLATRPWIAWFTNLGKQFGFFQTIQANGVNLPQELGLNFLSPLTAVDNPGNETIDIGFKGFTTVTTPDGTSLQLGAVLIEFGSSMAIGTGGGKVSVSVTFPQPFSAPPQVVCNPDNNPDNTGNQPFLCYPVVPTETGFTADFSCPVEIGGSGASGIFNQVHCSWHAMGMS